MATDLLTGTLQAVAKSLCLHSPPISGGDAMLKRALVFLVLAVIAAVFGFGNIAEGLADIARILFGVFLVVTLVFVVLGMKVYRSVT